MQIKLSRDVYVGHLFREYVGQHAGVLWATHTGRERRRIYCTLSVGTNHSLWGASHATSLAMILGCASTYLHAWSGSAVGNLAVYTDLWCISGIQTSLEYTSCQDSVVEYCRELCDRANRYSPYVPGSLRVI